MYLYWSYWPLGNVPVPVLLTHCLIHFVPGCPRDSAGPPSRWPASICSDMTALISRGRGICGDSLQHFLAVVLWPHSPKKILQFLIIHFFFWLNIVFWFQLAVMYGPLLAHAGSDSNLGIRISTFCICLLWNRIWDLMLISFSQTK